MFPQLSIWNWKEGELGTVKIGYLEKTRNNSENRLREREFDIPLVYTQLIDQLCCEMDHADHNSSHEALRRSAYATDILEQLGLELKTCEAGGPGFRSKVLNPILQRYLRGIPDSYTPIVQEAVAHTSAQVKKALTIGEGDDAEDDAREGTMPTILGATVFYLSKDPVDPKNTPYYRRNLVYLAEARWHLGIVADGDLVDDAEFFETVRVDHHDYVMEAYQDELQKRKDDEDIPRDDSDSDNDNEELPPPFSRAEVEVILSERLEKFFPEELASSVSKQTPFSPFHCY